MTSCKLLLNIVCHVYLLTSDSSTCYYITVSAAKKRKHSVSESVERWLFLFIVFLLFKLYVIK